MIQNVNTAFVSQTIKIKLHIKLEESAFRDFPEINSNQMYGPYGVKIKIINILDSQCIFKSKFL